MTHPARITPRRMRAVRLGNAVLVAAGVGVGLIPQLALSAVRGAMVIKPYGYAIWEAIQRELDTRIKATGHENVYFPLLVPASVLAQDDGQRLRLRRLLRRGLFAYREAHLRFKERRAVSYQHLAISVRLRRVALMIFDTSHPRQKPPHAQPLTENLPLTANA